MNLGDIYGTWRVAREADRSGNRAKFSVRCVHCNTERQMSAKHIRVGCTWHRGCSVKDPHISKRMSHKRGATKLEPSSSPQWQVLSDELDRNPDAVGWPASLLENVLAWRDCRRMDAQALTLDDHASRRVDRSAVP